MSYSDIWGASSGDNAAGKERIYLQLDIPAENVVFVDSTERLKECECDVMSPLTHAGRPLVAFDAEWIADKKRPGRSSLSMIQLAARSRVYLIDVCWFRERALLPELGAFVGGLFAADHVIKLGYSTTNDMMIFRQEFPMHMSNVEAIRSLFDLHRIFERAAGGKGAIAAMLRRKAAATGVAPKLRGLAKLVYRVLGCHLDKSEQTSNWHRRPLSQSQLDYAALDANCLLQVYHAVNKHLLAHATASRDLSSSTSPFEDLFLKMNARN